LTQNYLRSIDFVGFEADKLL